MKSITNLLLCFLLTHALVYTAAAQKNEKTAADAAIAFYKKGENLQKQRQYEKAILEYDYALAVSDTFSQAHFAKGLCLLAIEKPEKAIESLEKAVTLQKTLVPAYAALVKAHSTQGQEEEVMNSLNRLAEAETDISKKIEAKLRIVQILLKRKDYSSAHPYTKSACELDNNNLDALYYDAHVNNGLGNFEAARKRLEPLVQTLPADKPQETARFYYELGYAFHKLKMFEKSNDAFARADHGPFKTLIIKLTPEYFHNLGSCYNLVYQNEMAVKMLEEAIIINPVYASAYENLAQITVKQEISEKAVDYYKQAVAAQQDNKESVKLYETLIDALLNTGRYTEAISFSDECLAKALNARPVVFMKSIALLKMDKPQEAAIEIEKLLKDANLAPWESVKYHLAAGIIYSELKDYEKAEKVLVMARKGPFAHAVAHQMELLEDARIQLKYSN